MRTVIQRVGMDDYTSTFIAGTSLPATRMTDYCVTRSYERVKVYKEFGPPQVAISYFQILSSASTQAR